MVNGFIVGLAAALVSGVASDPAPVGGDSAQRAQVETWRAKRLERLSGPNGWLSLVGLEWLKPGRNTLGSAPDNSIVLSKWPAHLGTIEVAAGKA